MARSTPATGGRGRTPAGAGWWFTLAACTPAAWLIAFACLVLRARAVTGQWPAPYHPDPKDIGGIAAMVLTGTLPLIYFLGLFSAGSLVLLWSVPSVRVALREARLRPWHVYVGFAAVLLLAILLHGNPWQLRDWLAD